MNESKSLSNLNDAEIERQINTLDELNIGDHIIVSLNDSEYRHSILETLNKQENKIEIIYYDDSQIKCSFNKLEDQYDLNCEKSGVKKSLLTVDLAQFQIYKVDYSLNNQKCMTVEETLQKARKFLGQTKYNIFTNNDEHFCIYCKTGKAAKLFIVSPDDLNAKKIIGVDFKTKIVTNLAQESGQILLVNTAKHIATKFPRSAISTALPAAAEVAGGALGAGVEAISVGYDIFKKNQELKDGKINEMKFKKYIAKRVTRGVNSVAGGVAGGILGQMIIPVPVLGAVVGGLVGGVVGAAIGQVEGILLGEVVEVIDDKINEKKDQKPDIAVPETQFHVLQHLVFKFRKDLLFDEKEMEEKTTTRFYIDTKEAGINDEDYEIYILKDANETVTSLEVDKRKSIEAFSADELPSELNVFFKYSDLLEKEDKL